MHLKFVLFFLITLLNFTLLAQQKEDATLITIKFKKITLEQALIKLNEQYKIPLAYNSQETANHIITANFISKPVTQLITELVALAGMEVAQIDRVFVIKNVSNAQQINLVNISIKVVDVNSQEALPFALASELNTNIFATTNTQGFLSLLNIADTSQIQLSYLGYSDTIVSVKNIAKTIKLKPDPSLLKEVVVLDQGSNTITYGTETGKISFNPIAIDRLPVLGGTDVFRALQLLPGISGTNETSSGLVVRGSSPDKNLVLLDGYSLYHVDHFYGIYSSFNSKAIKNIQLYKGNFSAKYGGRSSSVMILTAKDGNKTKFSGDLGVNFVDINAVLEFALNDKLTLIAAARRSLTDVVDNYLFRELFDKAVINSGDANNVSSLDYKELNPKFNFGDLNIKMTYQPNLRDNFAVSFYSSNDNLSYEYESNLENFVTYTTSEHSNWGNLGVSGSWSRQWSKKLNSQVQIAYSSYFSNTKLEEGYVFNDTLGLPPEEYIQDQRNNVRDFTVKIDNQFRTSKNSILNFGIANTLNTIKLISIVDEDEFPTFHQVGNQLQLYGDFSLFITPKLETNIGLRSNYFDLTNKLYLEPKVNLKYWLTNWVSFKGSWGINNQMVSRILRLDLYTSNPDFWILSFDDVIPVINSNQWAGGVHLDFPLVTIDLEGFISYTYDEVEYLPRLRNFDTEDKNLDQLYAIGDNTTKGIEVMVEKGIGKYSGWVGYTLSNSLNLFKDLNGGKEFPSRYDQRHEVKIVNMYKVANWDFSLIWIYGTGKPYSSPEGSYSITTLDGSTINSVAYSRINNKRLPDYHRLDVSSTYNFNLGNTKAKVGLSIFNIYNRKNIKYRRFSKITFDEDGGLLDDDKYIISDILLLGITPSVFFNWRF